MSISEPKPRLAAAGVDNLRATVFNLPNQLTWLRLALAVVMFALLAFGRSLGYDRAVYAASLVLFAIAAGTDWLDGYLARRYGMVTTLGRILDPFADKVIVCGAFVFLAAVPGSGVTAWMAVVVIGRELLVTALRSFLEQQGADFSASLSGKLKMVLQCLAVGSSLFVLAYAAGSVAPARLRELAGTLTGGSADVLRLMDAAQAPAWMGYFVLVAVWACVALTVASGVAYVRKAIQLLRQAP
jgi:CDP-diacylglycerol--glycerol-3-phosphate 3-phosphatidyltransferase